MKTFGQAPQSQPAPLPTPAMQDAEGRTQTDTRLYSLLGSLTSPTVGSAGQSSAVRQPSDLAPSRQSRYSAGCDGAPAWLRLFIGGDNRIDDAHAGMKIPPGSPIFGDCLAPSVL